VHSGQNLRQCSNLNGKCVGCTPMTPAVESHPVGCESHLLLQLQCRRILGTQQGPPTVLGCCQLANGGWVAGLSPLQGVPSLAHPKNQPLLSFLSQPPNFLLYTTVAKSSHRTRASEGTKWPPGNDIKAANRISATMPNASQALQARQDKDVVPVHLSGFAELPEDAPSSVQC